MARDVDHIQPSAPEPAAIAPDPARTAGGHAPLATTAGLAIGLLVPAPPVPGGGGRAEDGP